MRRSLHLRIASLLLIACFSSHAATLRQLSMDQMTQAATAIVRARVTGSSASLTGSTIYTHYRLRVSETWKGFSTGEVMLPGGVASGLRQSFPGVPQLELGAEYILFLWTSPTGITHLVGLTQGLFNLAELPDGTPQALRSRIGETMLDATGHQVQDQAIQMNLSDMKSRVSTALAASVSK